MAAPVRIRGGTLTDAESALAKKGRVFPDQAPELRALSVATLAELRKTRGDRAGNRGPRCLMLAGYETPRDGGEGVFVWHDTLATPDNGGQGTAGVVEVAGVDIGRWVRLQLYPDPVPQTASVLAVRLIIAGASTPSTAGTRRAWARPWGAGGGGGGVAPAGGGQVNVGGGGGAGSPAEFWTTTIPVNWTHTIGAAGTAGSAAGGAGGNGGNTTFSDGVTTVTAPGGGGGAGDNLGAALPHLVNGGNGGAVATNGTVNGTGEQGGNAVHLAAAQAYSGDGASTSIAAGGVGQFGASFAGNAGSGPGAGGGGAIDKGTGVGRTGGTGGTGAIILVEFG